MADSRIFKDLQEKYQYQAIQIVLYAKPEILYGRFVKRYKSGLRHPAHKDEHTYDEYLSRFHRSKPRALLIDSTDYFIDTTNYNHINYNDLIKHIREIIRNSKVIK